MMARCQQTNNEGEPGPCYYAAEIGRQSLVQQTQRLSPAACAVLCAFGQFLRCYPPGRVCVAAPESANITPLIDFFLKHARHVGHGTENSRRATITKPDIF